MIYHSCHLIILPSLYLHFGVFILICSLSVLLYQNLVPISLIITVEIVKTIQSWLIFQDLEMYYEKLDSPAIPRNYNISDDLGQVNHIFSDKTGTLTQNVMQFKKCSVADGYIYGSTTDDSLIYTEMISILKNSNHVRYKKLHNLVLAISLCHSVLVDKVEENIIYKSQSPDESALIDAVRNIGYVLTDRNNDNVFTHFIIGTYFKYFRR